MDTDLDCSWITEEESRGYGNIIREKLHSIQCKFIYIGIDNSILKVVNEEEDLNDIGSGVGISNERILQLIQNKRFIDGGQRYKMMSLVKFLVDIEPQELPDFRFSDIDSLKSCHFLKEISFLGSIIIEPSLFCFHSLATLYFFLKQDEMLLRLARPILKSGNRGLTKKVRIFEEITSDDNICSGDINNHIKTRKVRI